MSGGLGRGGAHQGAAAEARARWRSPGQQPSPGPVEHARARSSGAVAGASVPAAEGRADGGTSVTSAAEARARWSQGANLGHSGTPATQQPNLGTAADHFFLCSEPRSGFGLNELLCLLTVKDMKLLYPGAVVDIDLTEDFVWLA